MEYLDIITVPIIVSAVYGGITLLKKAVKCKEKIMRLLPLIAAGMGAVLGLIAFFAVPFLIPASDAFTAVLIGGASGLAATGTNQVFKQLLSKGGDLLKKGSDLLSQAKNDEAKDDKEDGEK